MTNVAKTAYILLLVSAVTVIACANWAQIPGGLTQCVTASVNYLWAVNSADQIWMCARPCTGSNWVKVDGALRQIDAGDDEVWGVNSAHQIWKRPADGSGNWIRINGALKHVSASGNGYIWGVNGNDQIFKCKKPCSGSWIQVDGQLKQIDGSSTHETRDHLTLTISHS